MNTLTYLGIFFGGYVCGGITVAVLAHLSSARTARNAKPVELIRWFVVRKHPNGTAVIEEHTDESPASAAERLLRGESS